MSGESPQPVRWRVVPVVPAPVARGAAFQAVVTAAIKPGWHLYAMDEPEAGPLPLEFKTAAESPAVLLSVGADQPLGSPGTGNAGESFYVGRARFTLRLQVRPLAALGEDAVALTARFQACNDRMCLPPQTSTMELPLTVTEHAPRL